MLDGVELGGEVLGFTIEAMVAPASEGLSRRYEELKESVRALRAQVRNGNAQSSSSCTASAVVGSIAPAAAADAGYASTGTSCSRAVTPRQNLGGVDPRIGAPDESFSMQHLRLQFYIEMQVPDNVDASDYHYYNHSSFIRTYRKRLLKLFCTPMCRNVLATEFACLLFGNTTPTQQARQSHNSANDF